jgi:hypothetical protein
MKERDSKDAFRYWFFWKPLAQCRHMVLLKGNKTGKRETYEKHELIVAWNNLKQVFSNASDK